MCLSIYSDSLHIYLLNIPQGSVDSYGKSQDS